MRKIDEYEASRKLANYILNTPYKDPDDNESVLARQLLRADEKIESLEKVSAYFRAFNGSEVELMRGELMRRLDRFLADEDPRRYESHKDSLRRCRNHLLDLTKKAVEGVKS